jgi:hypothetical protein
MARLTKDKVVVLADREAKKRGYDLSKYETPKISFRRKDHTWTVHYEGKRSMPGNHFVVWVDDLMGGCELMGGK